MSLETRNADLNQKIEESNLPDAVNTLLLADKRRRLQLRLLTLSLAISIVLTIAVGFLSFKTHSIASQAENAHDSIVATCEASNEARSNNKEIWGFLLGIQTPSAPTLQQQAVRSQFQDLVDKTFAPRDCSKIQ